MKSEGKADARVMESVYGHLGAPSGAVLTGPGRGLDNAVVSVGRGRVMLVTVDPVSAIPSLGMALSARLSVHLVASDFTASGVDPQFAVFSYNFPPAMTTAQKREYVTAIGDECERLGVSVVAGHTGSYPGGGFTVIGAGVMLGTASERGYVTPAMAREGDVVLATKHAGIEATATLAASFPRFLSDKVGRRAVRRASAMAKLCTTVADARAARGAGLGKGRVTSMHDATEGGVLGALGEMAEASGKAYVVSPEKIPVSAEASMVCRAFGIDPLKTMGEGSLLITCGPEAAPALQRRMFRAGIRAARIGHVKRGKGLWLNKDGRIRVAGAEKDGFWAAYDRAVRLGLE